MSPDGPPGGRQGVERSTAPHARGRRTPLKERVGSAAEAALRERKFVTAIDVLTGIGWLLPKDVEAWRRGQVPYLERVVHANLHKISTAMHLFRAWAAAHGLRPSETVYMSHTRRRHVLRFSRSGDEGIERAYRTHFLSPELAAAKALRRRGHESEAADRPVADP